MSFGREALEVSGIAVLRLVIKTGWTLGEPLQQQQRMHYCGAHAHARQRTQFRALLLETPVVFPSVKCVHRTE